MDGGFDRERRIADSARAGNKRNNDRRFNRVSVPRRRADPPDNLENFLRESRLGDPVGVAGLNESLVIPGGNITSDDDEENVSRTPADSSWTCV
jgi:hypothetical protein